MKKAVGDEKIRGSEPARTLSSGDMVAAGRMEQGMNAHFHVNVQLRAKRRVPEKAPEKPWQVE